MTIDTDVKVSLWYGDLSLLGIYPRVGWTGLYGSSPFKVLRNPYLVPQWLYTFNRPSQGSSFSTSCQCLLSPASLIMSILRGHQELLFLGGGRGRFKAGFLCETTLTVLECAL